MYSQNAEEDVILRYFTGQTGVFLDLGAYDGVRLSNTRALAEAGWAGVAIEASPFYFKQLEDNYRGLPVQLLNVAIGETDGTAIFYDSPDGCSGTLLSRETARWQGYCSFVPIEVPCVTIHTLLRHLNCPTIDMISCDLEGLDLAVMADLPFAELKTRLVVVEFNGNNYDAFASILAPHFSLVYTSPENLIWAKPRAEPEEELPTVLC